MPKPFHRGDHVGWNSEAGRVRGHILRVHTKDVDYKGYVHHATPDDPQSEIKSDRTDHVALPIAGCCVNRSRRGRKRCGSIVADGHAAHPSTIRCRRGTVPR